MPYMSGFAGLHATTTSMGLILCGSLYGTTSMGLCAAPSMGPLWDILDPLWYKTSSVGPLRPLLIVQCTGPPLWDPLSMAPSMAPSGTLYRTRKVYTPR